MQIVNWKDATTPILMNPRITPDEQEYIFQALSKIHLPAHCWIGTSGTTGRSKWIALSKKALMHSAAAVNAHLKSHSDDIWLHALPKFHVGGLGIDARGFLSGAQVIYLNKKWDATAFHQKVLEEKVTLSALVPTQLYDLIEKKLSAPQSLRALIIGGGALSPFLYDQARKLGWPLLPSYGMTECASQVATASLDSLQKDAYPPLQRLSHVEVSKNALGCFRINSPSLFTLAAMFDHEGNMTIVQRAAHEPFDTQDRGEIVNNYLVIQGRVDEVIKVSGECVDMNRLNQLLDELRMGCPFDATLQSISDARLGNAICLFVASTPSAEVDALIEKYNGRVLPFERIRDIHYLNHIPRTPLGKVLFFTKEESGNAAQKGDSPHILISSPSHHLDHSFRRDEVMDTIT